jgi:penicillin-insensitive murein endopeptidase
MKRRGLMILTITLLVWLTVYYGNDLLRQFESDKPSRSHGSTSNGWLEFGKRLPTAGQNFTTYSRLGALLGRTSVHDKVRATVLGAFASVHRELPNAFYTVGETGWPSGGRFRPHKTHQNGLSMDFMVPVKIEGGGVQLPANIWNKFGYGLEFDARGKAGNMEIDFEAMGAHLFHLHRAAQRNGVDIEVVIFDNELQKRLFASQRGAQLKHRIRFSTQKPWIRHDEHYHVNFRV